MARIRVRSLVLSVDLPYGAPGTIAAKRQPSFILLFKLLYSDSSPPAADLWLPAGFS
jgi:hypothetical protein